MHQCSALVSESTKLNRVIVQNSCTAACITMLPSWIGHPYTAVINQMLHKDSKCFSVKVHTSLASDKGQINLMVHNAQDSLFRIWYIW